MIVFVSTVTHAYTHKAIAAAVPGFRRMSWPEVFARRRLPRATYIFSDFDRLNFWQVECAAHLANVLSDAGCRVLNGPARVLSRLALLRRLERSGVNSFRAWPATEADTVDRFPVFLRTAAAHRGNRTDLLTDRAALEDALERLLVEGYPLTDLVIVEYRAAPIRGDVFRKLSVYRVGERLVAMPSVHERAWTAKRGENWVAGEDGYREDLDIVRDNPHAGVLSRAFALAGIDYGRADFGIVAGRPEVYEINTNPMMFTLRPHDSPDRSEAIRLSVERVLDAVRAIDDPRRGSVRVPRPAAAAYLHKRVWILPGYQWVP